MSTSKSSNQSTSAMLQSVIDINRALLGTFKNLNLELQEVGNGFHRSRESRQQLRGRFAEMVREVKASRDRLHQLRSKR